MSLFYWFRLGILSKITSCVKLNLVGSIWFWYISKKSTFSNIKFTRDHCQFYDLVSGVKKKSGLQIFVEKNPSVRYEKLEQTLKCGIILIIEVFAIHKQCIKYYLLFPSSEQGLLCFGCSMYRFASIDVKSTKNVIFWKKKDKFRMSFFFHCFLSSVSTHWWVFSNFDIEDQYFFMSCRKWLKYPIDFMYKNWIPGSTIWTFLQKSQNFLYIIL